MDEVSAHVNALSKAVIGAALEVHTILGPGLLESTYENALGIELRSRGIAFVRQPVIEIGYKGFAVGEQRLDLLIENALVLELKAVEDILPLHLAQLRAYLVALKLELGLLINFNSIHLKNGVKRVVNL